MPAPGLVTGGQPPSQMRASQVSARADSGEGEVASDCKHRRLRPALQKRAYAESPEGQSTGGEFMKPDRKFYRGTRFAAGAREIFWFHSARSPGSEECGDGKQQRSCRYTTFPREHSFGRISRQGHCRRRVTRPRNDLAGASSPNHGRFRENDLAPGSAMPTIPRGYREMRLPIAIES